MRHMQMMMLTALVLGMGVSAADVNSSAAPKEGEAVAEQSAAPTAADGNRFEAGRWVKNAPYFHFQDAELTQRIRPQVLPLVRLEQRTQADGSVALDIVKDKEIETLAGDKASNISGSWKYPLTFQPGEQGALTLEFDYETVSTGKFPTRACILQYYTREGKTVTLRAKPIKLVNGKRTSFQSTIDILPETDGVQIHLRFDGCGKMTFINPRLSMKK